MSWQSWHQPMRGTFASLHRNDFCPNTPCTAFLQQGVWLWTDNSSSTASVSNSATPFVPLGPKSTCGCSMGTRSSSNGGFRPTYRPLYVLAGVMSVLLLSGWSQHSCRDSSSIISLSLRHSSENSTPVIQPAALVLGNVDNSKQLGSPTVGSPPYRLPRLIHQTVANKSRLSCEEKHAIESWKTLNPNHTHRLWDDADMRAFMVEHYPDLVPVPYDSFVKGTERSDLWRVLVLHKYGGVYADIDVECLKPIDTWNMQHGNDAAVLLGMENFDAKRKPHKVHVTNWAIAAMPGHPLLGLMPSVVTKAIQQQYFALARAQTKALSPQLYENGILDRTGPAALTTAMYDYFDSIKFDLNNVTQADINGEKGVLAGGVRVLPVVALSSGWEVAAARSKAQALTCADVAKNKPQALVCHMFFGSWRTSWGLYTPKRTYDTC